MKASVYFVDDRIRQSFFALATGTAEENEVYTRLNASFDIIALKPFCGIQVPFNPDVYVTKYGIDNLWKYHFHKNWRMMYSVAGDGTTVIALVIEWLPHKEYERRFGY